MTPLFKVWITEYALTMGIQIADVQTTHADGMVDGVVEYRVTGIKHDWWGSARGEGRDWHRTPDSALRRAEAMRRAKIASLKKSIAKLEAMQFVAPCGDVEGTP